jgi:site-specific DNA recombinase
MDTLAGLRVAAYARFSSDDKRQTSIDDQLKWAHEFVEARGNCVIPDLVFTDSAMSGARNNREDFERLMRLVERRGVDVIVCEATDRLSRDLGDADRVWKIICFHNVRLICISDGIDSSNEQSRTIFGVKAMFADEYLLDLGKKTSRGLFGGRGRG